MHGIECVMVIFLFEQDLMKSDSGNLDISAAPNACVLRAVRSCAPSSCKLSCLSSLHRLRITSPSAQCQMQITEADSAALILPHPRPHTLPIHSLHLADYTAAESAGATKSSPPMCSKL